jgi:hypothetical protein
MSIQDKTNDKALDPWDIGFGVVILVSALLAIFVWFPNDIRSGFFYVNAIGRTEPGDAFFPIILSTTLVILSGIQLYISLFHRSPYASTEPTPAISKNNFKFLFTFGVICILGLSIMYSLGPVTVWTLREFGLIDAEYRHLTDTAPFKYLGYVVGGFIMTVTLIAWTEGHVRRPAVLTVLTVLFVAIIIFDKFLTNVLLPPNAEF